jgi:hypothetical protein
MWDLTSWTHIWCVSGFVLKTGCYSASTWVRFEASPNGGVLRFFLQHLSMLACRSPAGTSCCLIFQLCARLVLGACSFWIVCALVFMCFRATSRFRHWLPYVCIAFCPIPGTSLLRRLSRPLTLSIPLISPTHEDSSHTIAADLSSVGGYSNALALDWDLIWCRGNLGRLIYRVLRSRGC